MKSNPGVWFEIPVTDLDRAEKFYKEAFGFTCARQPAQGPITMSFFPMEEEDKTYGAAGALVLGDGFTPSHDGSMIYLSTGDVGIDATVEKALAAGAKVVIPKMDIGQYGFIAHLEDTEGNRIGIHEEPAGA